MLAGVAGLFAYLALSGAGDLLDPGLLWNKLAKPLLRLLVMLGAGLLVGQALESLGLSARIGRIAGPVIRRAHLPAEAGASFAAAFVSGIAANTLLYTSWQEGKLDKRQLILANVLNASLPAYFLHLPSTFFIVYALLGDAALVYFGLTLLAAVLRSVVIVLIGGATLPPSDYRFAESGAKRVDWREVAMDTWTKFLTRFRRLLMIILPVYVLIFLLVRSGFFPWLGETLARWVSSEVLPVEAMSVVVFSVVAEFTSGFAAAAALLHTGGLTLQQAVVALLMGNMVATPVRVLRHQLPHYLGIYSPGVGMTLLAIGQGTRVASVLLVTIFYIWLG